MITLKHLAREYDYDPYKLRMMLRRHFGIRRRWRWDPENPQEKADLSNIRKTIEAQNETRSSSRR